jgi:hypothetical protein
MRLIVAHKILMSAFLGLCLLLFVRGVRLYSAGGSSSDLVLGFGAAVVGGGLVLYLRRIWHS